MVLGCSLLDGIWLRSWARRTGERTQESWVIVEWTGR